MTVAPGRSVTSNAASLFLGRLISALSIWLALIILAKLSDAATVGTYALAQAICIPIADIAMMGLREARSSDMSRQYTATDYFSLRAVMAIIAFAVMVGFGATQSDTLTVLAVIGIYGLARVVYLMTDILHAHFQQVERLDYTGWSLCLSGVLSLLALTFGYILTGSIIAAVAGQALAHLAVYVFYDLPISRRYVEAEKAPSRWHPGRMTSLARLALPLTFATVLFSIGLYLPRLWVGSALGLAALGIFGPILALAMAPDRLINSICQALSVRLAMDWHAGEVGRMFYKLGTFVGVILLFGLPAIWIAHLFGEQILTFVYTEEQAAYSGLLVSLAIAALLRVLANVLSFGLIASRRFWLLTLQHGVTAIVAVLACFFLIGPYGIEGAGWTMILVFGAQLLVVTGALLHLWQSAAAPR